MDSQEEIIRLIATQIRLLLNNQNAAIQELSKSGFGPSRIAELLGTTPGTVNVSLAKAKKRAKKTSAIEEA
jgi:DNA-directed RNA polymerase specialized sigma24 family protein